MSIADLNPDDLRRITETEKRMADGRAGWDASEYVGRDGIEGAVYGSNASGQRWATWHGRGINLEDEHVFTAKRAMQLVPELGLDVLPRKIGWQDDEGAWHEIMDEVANVREDGVWLANVTKRYQRVQPWEAFQFMDDLVDSGDAKYHTAMTMRGGRTVAMLAVIPETVKLLGMTDEEIQLYLYLTNSYDRSSGLTVALTPVRVVCTNTELLAINTAPRSFTMRHTEGITGKLQAARQTLGIVQTYVPALEAVAEMLAGRKLSRNGFEAFMDELVPVPKVEDPEKSKRKLENRDKVTGEIRSIYETAPNLENVRGTAWAALNAVGEYVDWYSPVKGGTPQIADERRMRRQLEPSVMKDRALELLLAV